MADLILPVGTSGFESIRKNGYYFVDKSSVISKLIRDGAAAILFTRPRRFGKTTVMTMLSSFFDISKDSRSLFEGLSIMHDEKAVNEWMNSYPVISLSLRKVEGLTFFDAVSRLKSTLYSLFSSFSFLLEDELSIRDRNIMMGFLSGEASLDDIKDSLSSLSMMLFAHYQKPVILLIDEYDVPLSQAEQNGYYGEMLDLLRAIFSVLKDDAHIEKAVMTGCLRISKESLFTGLNNLMVYSLLSDDYANSFGFTEQEVESILGKIGCMDKKEIVQSWYDGYMIGGLSMYCPWDVVSYMKALQGSKDALPMNYWANTSGNDVIRRFIDETHASISEEYSSLISGRSIEREISENLTYNDLYSYDNNVWSLLLETGYLTLASRYIPGRETELRIPNEEIRDLFITSVNSWFKDRMQKEDRGEIFKALLSGNEKVLQDLVTDHLEMTINYYDYSEEFYHAFIAGLFSSNVYYVKSNRESGLGRYDLLVADIISKKAAILEFKTVKRESDIRSAIKEALAQIDERKYDLDFRRYDVSCYAVVFYKKSATVKLRT